MRSETRDARCEVRADALCNSVVAALRQAPISPRFSRRPVRPALPDRLRLSKTYRSNYSIRFISVRGCRLFAPTARVCCCRSSGTIRPPAGHTEANNTSPRPRRLINRPHRHSGSGDQCVATKTNTLQYYAWLRPNQSCEAPRSPAKQLLHLETRHPSPS